MNTLFSATRRVRGPDAGLAVWIGFFLFAVYLLSFSGKFHVMDELMGFATGNNLVQHGRPDVDQLIWTNHWQEIPPAWWGVDNHLYTKKAPGIALAAAPFIWLGHTAPGLNAVHTSLLLSAIATALAGSLLFIWLRNLGFTRPVAALSALGYGLGTIAWVYARFLWEPAMMALIFLALVWAMFRYQSAPRGGWVLLAGVVAAVGLLMRFEMAAATGLAGMFLLWQAAAGQPWKQLPRRLPALARLFGLYLGPSLVVGLGLLYFNYARFGSITETGYNREMSFIPPWIGGFGLLFSPGRGLFIYSPLMLLLFFGLRPAWRRLPRPYFLLVASICVFYWLFYGSWFAWGGTWGWGPRFLMPVLPLLMVFVAEPLAWAVGQTGRVKPARTGIGLLALASLFVNFLAVTVDFNEHYLRLGRNDNFVFNWAAMPLLGHWKILQEGLVDLLWLRPGPTGLAVDASILAPAAGMVAVTAAGLGLAAVAVARPNHRRAGFVLAPGAWLAALVLVAGLVFVTMQATARAALDEAQAQADLPVLDTLANQAQPGDALLIPMPPFGDVQEISTRVMAYLDRPLPTYAWIESEPRAVQPEERERIWQAVRAGSRRVWLFERWLTPADPLGPSAARFNREAFPVWERWFEQSGKLTLFTLAKAGQQPAALPLGIPFEGGMVLAGGEVLNNPVAAGQVLQVRLTWQAPAVGNATAAGLPNQAVTGFVHLLDREPGAGPVAQQDRLVLNLQAVEQSPLRPGQTVAQGYGLQLPVDLPPGNYPLVTGLYLAGTGRRLARGDGSPDDFLYLMDIQVQ